jgi:signal transduction histidine kinase
MGSVEVTSDEFGEFVAVQRPQLRALDAAIYARTTGKGTTIAYVEPPDRRPDLLGVDLTSVPDTRETLRRVGDATEPVASTGAVFWVFLRIAPDVSSRGAESAAVQGSAAQQPGVAGIRLRSDVLWEHLIVGPNRERVGYQISAADALGVMIPHYTEGPIDRSKDRQDRTIETTIPLDVAGGAWTLRLVADRSVTGAMEWLPAVILVVGLATSTLLFGLVRVQISARAAAEHLSELREEFLSAAAHELKTPVAAIKGYAQLLREWDQEELRRNAGRALASIERQSNRIDRLVQQLLEASRLRRQDLKLAPERMDLLAIVRQVSDDMRTAFPRHHFLVTSEGRCAVFADRARIEQVLTNLLSNAAKFSPPGSEIRVHVGEMGDEVVTSVQDSGIGIPADRQRDIFERYYQAHRGTPYEGVLGLGLGLYLCKQIVNAHGGRIWFESTYGKGSTFRVSLPLAKEAS